MIKQGTSLFSSLCYTESPGSVRLSTVHCAYVESYMCLICRSK